MTRLPLRRTGRHQAGFGLVETMIGLTLLGVTLLLTAGLLATLPRELTRIDARHEAHRAMGAALESLRAGEITATSGKIQPVLYEWVQARPPAAQGLRLWLHTEATETPGLYDVEVQARYLVHRQPVEKRVVTRIWRP